MPHPSCSCRTVTASVIGSKGLSVHQHMHLLWSLQPVCTSQFNQLLENLVDVRLSILDLLQTEFFELNVNRTPISFIHPHRSDGQP